MNRSPSTLPTVPPTSRVAQIGVPLLVLIVHLATTGGYGIFRDELYYLSCARRLAWGYVDHPPMIAWVVRLVIETLGESLLALRSIPALCLALVVALLAATTRELGGSRRAQLLAAAAAALAPILLALGSIVSMNAIDLALHAAMWWTLARWSRSGDGRLWLLFGFFAGLGLETKASTVFLGVALALVLVLLRRGAFADWRLWAGGAIAVLLGLPHLIWQHLHQYPTLEFAANASRDKNIALAPVALASEAVLQFGPFAGVLVLLGLFAAVSRLLGPHRFLAVIPVGVFALMLGANAKAYYLAASFLVLVALGAVVTDRIGRPRLVAGIAVGLGLLTLLLAPLAKPLLPLETYVAYAEALGDAPSTSERHELGRLKQFYADMFGWRELAEAVAAVTATLTPAERELACVFTGNYGQAGAIEHFGRELDLPPPISGHNTWFLWGPQGCSGEVLLVLGRSRERLDSLFEDVTLGGTTNCGDCMPYENQVPIWIARTPREGVSLEELWPDLKHYD